MRAALFSTLLVLGLAGCSSETAPTAQPEAKPQAVQPQQAPQQAPQPNAQKQFGAPITEAKTTALADLFKEPAKYVGQTVRTEGKVTAVCKSMGCWMEIGDDTGTAHIKMAGHSFFVPKNASGRRAVVQGKMLSSAEESGTCAAQDGCREAHEKESGKVAKLELEATGVELLD